MWFKNCKNSHYRVVSSVHIDRGTEHVLGWNSALRHGPVLNHPLSGQESNTIVLIDMTQDETQDTWHL